MRALPHEGENDHDTSGAKNTLQHGEQAHSPVEGQQASTRTTPRQWVKVLLHVLGIVVPLVGGFAICFLPLISINFYLGYSVTTILIVILCFVGARLLGSWWAMLVVPFALAIGQILGTTFLYGAELELALLNWPSYVLFGIVPAATGAIPSNQTIVFWFLTYGGVVVLLSLILLGRVKGAWPALWRTLLMVSVGAAIVIAILVARGPDDWKYPPNGLDVLLASLVVGVLILIVGYWFSGIHRKPNQLTST